MVPPGAYNVFFQIDWSYSEAASLSPADGYYMHLECGHKGTLLEASERIWGEEGTYIKVRHVASGPLSELGAAGIATKKETDIMPMDSVPGIFGIAPGHFKNGVTKFDAVFLEGFQEID